MRKIIVDTNIIFSCLLNVQSNIGDLIFNSWDLFDFYSCQYMQFEIRNHWNKLLKISHLTNEQLEISYQKLLTRFTFIDEELIPEKIWIKAEQIASSIDIDDIAFIALTRFLKGGLWTGDKALYNGLKEQQFRAIYNTQDLLNLRNRLSK